MMKLFLLWVLFLLLPVGPAAAQDKMSQTSSKWNKFHGETVADDALLPMNELDMDFGYAPPYWRQPLMWKREPH